MSQPVSRREKWRTELLKGVKAIPVVNIVPGTILVYGKNAEPILTTKLVNNVLIAAAELEKGRVLAIAHNSYIGKFLKDDFKDDDDLSCLWNNIKHWVSRGKYSTQSKIGLIDEIHNIDVLASYSVLLWEGAKQSQHIIHAIVEFVKNGGGVVCGMCPWGYLQIHRGVLENMASYKLFSEIGICYTSEYLDGVTNDTIQISENKAMNAHLIHGCHDDSLLTCLHHLPSHAQELFIESVEERFNNLKRSCNYVPSENQPLQTPEEITLALLFQTLVSFGKIKKAEGVEHFPGDFSANPLMNINPVPLTFSCLRGDVFATGYYLPAGAVLSVKVETEIYDGWFVQIGSHSDDLSKKSELRRWPKICIKREITQKETSVESPFGGLIYFISPGKKSSLNMTITNVVKAPYFNIAEPSSCADWFHRSRAEGLWGDFIGKYIMITLPKQSIQHIPEPSHFISFWDKVVEAHHAVRGTDPSQHRCQWIVPDVQPSCGYMHSGYPIVTHMDIADPQANVCLWNTDILATHKNQNWGLFHEIGHNMQRGEWTFEGAGEVTVNIFTLHAMDRLCGMKPWTHPWLAGAHSNMRKYLLNGAKFEEWKMKPAVGLAIYAQLARDFGWEVYNIVFRTYEDDIINKRPGPANDQDKIDRWMVRFSQTVKMNLSPMFKFWGIPLSDTAMAIVANLAPFLHQDETTTWVPDRVQFIKNTAISNPTRAKKTFLSQVAYGFPNMAILFASNKNI